MNGRPYWHPLGGVNKDLLAPPGGVNKNLLAPPQIRINLLRFSKWGWGVDFRSKIPGIYLWAFFRKKRQIISKIGRGGAVRLAVCVPWS